MSFTVKNCKPCLPDDVGTEPAVCLSETGLIHIPLDANEINARMYHGLVDFAHQFCEKFGYDEITFNEMNFSAKKYKKD